jgi:hypothetical protein
MSMLYTKVKKYLEANSKTVSEFENNIILKNDGAGDFIDTWNVSGLAKPTDEQLASYNSSATTEENNNKVIGNRLNEYPSLGDIVDAIFKKEAGDATEFNSLAAKRQSIKDANPKE